MALIHADRVKETSTTTGTGTYTLAGAATGFQSFSAIGNGNTCYYTAEDGTNWEVGLGTYTSAGTTLARTTVLASSNAGAAVNWAAGTRNIFVSPPASKFRAIGEAVLAADLPAASDSAKGGIQVAVQADQETATSTTLAVTPGRQQFHPSACKAWLRFNSAVSVAANYNITSVTDNGTGDWTVNIGTDFSSANYAGVAFGGYSGASLIYHVSSQAAGTFRILSHDYTLTLGDPTTIDAIEAVFFGDQ